jgi:phosphinothricin acetyltransferase
MSGAIDVRLRAAEAVDLPVITALYADHVRAGTASFELDPPDEAEMTRRWNDIVARGLPYLVAMRGDQTVGYAYAGPYRPRPAYRFTVEDSVYIRPDCAGQGIGRMLLDALIAACERGGMRQMIAVIGDSANTPSIRLHASAGFTHAGLLSSVGWKFGRWIDVVLMQRTLGAGDTRPV